MRRDILRAGDLCSHQVPRPAAFASYNQLMFGGRPSRSAIRPLIAAAWVTFAVAVCWAAKQFVMPAVQPARTYPAHDEHTDEAATVAADAYDTPEKARIFSVNYREIGMLPILLIITNDGDQPISLSGLKAELVTGDRIKLLTAVPDDIFRRIAHPHTSSATTYPLPFPTKKVKGGMSTANPGRNRKCPICRQSGRTAQYAGGILVLRCAGDFLAPGWRSPLSHGGT